MKIGGKGKILIEIEEDAEIKEISKLAREQKLSISIIGEGSNTIFSDEDHKKAFVKFKQKNIIKLYENDDFVNLKVSSGINWDKFVGWAVSNNFSGVENLSAIPGSVGASPIQNIGAYGQEVKNVITYVEIYEFETNKFYEIPNSECGFGYRDSIFKKNLNKFAITNVSFRLNKREPEFPNYKDLSLFFLERQNKKPTLKEIREAVVEIRSSKLPDWNKNPNCGSFFKNPVLSNKLIGPIVSKYPDMPIFKAQDGYTKISGGWLIEKCDLKGKIINKIQVHPKSGLVLINKKGASFKDLESAVEKIQDQVKEKFGLTLEVEPNLIK